MKQPLACTLERASFRYAGRRKPVGPFDLAVSAGEFHLISGRSGSGKSTMARLLCGAIPHLYRGELRGRVEIDGQEGAALPLWQLAERVGLIGQNPAAQLLASTVEGEIVFGLENLGIRAAELERRLAEAVTRFELADLLSRDPRRLSGGEQQRVVIAAIAARHPQLMIADEPLSMLDAPAAASVVESLAQLSRGGAAVVVFEHRRRAFADVAARRERHLAADEMPDAAVPALSHSVSDVRVEVRGLCVDRGRPAALADVDLSWRGGRVVAVTGENGAGKTTLLRALAGLERHRGRISIDSSAPAVNGRIGLCFQNPDRQLFNATVREEILCGLRHPDMRLYGDILSLLGLAAYEHAPPLLLSEGEKKRLGLAILLMRPGLAGICIDEPTLGQDEHNRGVLGRIVRRLAAAGYLCVVATHDCEWANAWCDEALVLSGGRVVAAGAPQDVLVPPLRDSAREGEAPCRAASR